MSRARSIHVLGVVLLGLVGPRATGASESSISCDRGIVAVGDTKLALLGKCGEPALRDARPSLREALVVPGAAAVTTTEEWTYDFGPDRFLMLVRLEGGKVVSVERGGYGYDPARLAPNGGGERAKCDASAMQIGDRKVDLFARCGEPTTRDVGVEQREVPAASGPAGTTGLRTVQVEVWTYDLGPRRFIAILTLEDGKVVEVERGSYGFAE